MHDAEFHTQGRITQRAREAPSRKAPPHWQTRKIAIDVYLETDNQHCDCCFKSFSLGILVSSSIRYREENGETS